MTGFRRFSVPIALAVVLTSAAAAPQAPSTARGRAVFDEKGCQHCHSYVARRAGPSVRDLLRDFVGEPVKTSKAINAVREHQEDLHSGKISTKDIRLISEWLASDFWPDEESEEAAEKPVVQAAVVPQATPQAGPQVAAPVTPLVAAKPALPSGNAPKAVSPVQPYGPSVTGIRVQKDKSGADRLVVDLAGGEPDEIDMQTINGQLVVKITGATLASSTPQLVNTDSAVVVGSVRATSQQRTVEVTVSPRVADWTYTAVQGRARLTIDLSATTPRKSLVAAGKPAAEKSVAQGKAGKPEKTAKTAVTAADSTAAKAAGTAVAAATTAVAGAAAASKPETKPPVTVARAEPDTATQARREAEAARAREATKAKAAEEAAAQAALKREAEARAKRDAELQAKAKREADAQAAAKRTAEVDEAWQAAEAQAKGKTQRKISKKEYKEPKLDPCPPASPADQVIGVVDVERAKEIIDRVGCPQCHAYVQKKTGPPFKEVLKKYSGDPACVIYRLKTNETHKDEGVTKDIRPNEFKILADYVATRMKKD